MAVTQPILAQATAIPPPKGKASTSATLTVTVETPLGAGIPGAEVKLAGAAKLTQTTVRGRADFVGIPIGAYTVTARKSDFGEIPQNGEFKIGETTGSVQLSDGDKKTLPLTLLTAESLTVENFVEDVSHKERIFKAFILPSATSFDVEITATVKAPSGPATHAPVRVEWSVTADATNAPDQNGGLASTAAHFASATGFPVTGNLQTAASTVSDSSGVTKIRLLVSIIAGDKYVVHARVLRDPANPSIGSLKTADSRHLEIWKKLDVPNVFQMVDKNNPANKGVDLGPITDPTSIAAPFAKGFTLYTRGPVQTTDLFKEFISELDPTPAQLPKNEAIDLNSSGPDSRVVTIFGLVVQADNSVTAGQERLTLAGNAKVTSTKRFQRLDRAVVSSADRTLMITVTGAAQLIGFIIPDTTSETFKDSQGRPGFLFDDIASVNKKARDWETETTNKSRNDLKAFLEALRQQHSASGKMVVGCVSFHRKFAPGPKAVTSFYLGFKDATISNGITHPDGMWGETNGNELNDGSGACLYRNLVSQGFPDTLERRFATAVHEIGHLSDHTNFDPRPIAGKDDHCDQRGCVMFNVDTNSTTKEFCTIGKTDSNGVRSGSDSLRRLMGWRLR